MRSPRPRFPLGREPVGRAREERGLAHVGEAEEEHDDALEADAAAAVRQRAVAEGVDVALDAVHGDLVGVGALHQELRLVDALRAGEDLLAADEEVVAVRVRRVHGAGHRVERPRRERVLVHHVEVRVVLLLDDAAERLLLLRRRVLVVVHLVAGLAQQRHALLEGDAQARVLVLEVLEGVLRAHGLDLVAVALVQPVEDVAEQVREHLEHLVVVLLEGHLHVQPRELAEVAVRVAVLGAEDGPDLHDALEAGARRAHLLVELRRLREAGVVLEVLELEHVRAALGGAADDLGRVDLDEALVGLGFRVRVWK
mmetsp:Transcript_8208/g.23372  ORF Transcript_8208/g.23372 Transcript_8208/m.23372 type:complete len:312 (-) Transcript_8208:98-1033(-)